MDMIPRNRDPVRARVRAVVLIAAIGLVAVGCGAPEGSVPSDAATPTPGSAIGTTPRPASTVAPDPGATSPAPNPTSAATSTPTPKPVPSRAPAIGVAPCPGSPSSAARRDAAATGSSANWSGYIAASTKARFTCVEATWTQPKVRCRRTGTQGAAYWIGLGGDGQRGLVQVGTGSSCIAGKASVDAWRQSLPAETYAIRLDLGIRPGDPVRAQVRALGSGRYRLTLVDLRNGRRSVTVVTNRVVKPTTAEWIVEAPVGGCPKRCRMLALPDFGTVAFRDADASYAGRRASINGAGTAHIVLEMTTTSGAVRSKPGDLGPAGTSFEVSWRRS